jgi:hypothetical protein
MKKTEENILDGVFEMIFEPDRVFEPVVKGEIILETTKNFDNFIRQQNQMYYYRSRPSSDTISLTSECQNIIINARHKLKRCVHSPRDKKKIPESQFVEFCLGKRICTEECAKYIYQYSYK